MGWDGIDFGYGVTTALMIVQWPTTFLPGLPPFGSVGLFQRKITPTAEAGATRRYYNNTIQYSGFGKEVARVTKVPQPDAESQQKQKKNISPGLRKEILVLSIYS